MRSVAASPEGYLDTFLSVDFLHHYILPFTVAVVYYSGDFLLLARNGVVEKRGSEFLKLHRAKGLSEMQQLARAGRNSMLPILTYFALRLGMIFQGLILLEVVFGWPGIGRELVLAIQQQEGILKGAYDSSWSPAWYYCLTGNAQMAAVWLRLYDQTDEQAYRQEARTTVEFLKRHHVLDGPPAIRGAIAGSYPLCGSYMYLRYPNWAGKFFADVLLWLIGHPVGGETTLS